MAYEPQCYQFTLSSIYTCKVENNNCTIDKVLNCVNGNTFVVASYDIIGSKVLSSFWLEDIGLDVGWNWIYVLFLEYFSGNF